MQELHGLDATTITGTIINKVESELGLSLDNCLSVTFDGASTMSGSVRGVQAQIKQRNPEIVYVHCFNHVLNLCLVDTVRQLSHFLIF